MNTTNGGLVLGKKIYESIKNKTFRSFIILGDRDIGKSTYALKALFEAFTLLGYDKKDAWGLALSCIKFSIPSVTSYLKEGTELYKKTHTKKPAIVWDDLRKYAGGIQYHINRDLYNEIAGLLDTVKIPVSCFIGTCPSMKGVMGILQDYDSYQLNVQYSTRGGKYRLAKGYLWRTTPAGQRKVYSKFEDTFFCRLPNKIWLEYEKDRIKASEQSIEAMEEIAKKKEIAEYEWILRQHRVREQMKQMKNDREKEEEN